jgi:succinyl-CoA:acetate CoA-transferase
MNYYERMKCKALEDRIMSAERAASFIKSGMTVGTSGFTPTGYPKAVPEALAKIFKEDKDFKINLFTGASVGKSLDSELGGRGIINRRMPYQTNIDTRQKINEREIRYSDIHLSHFPQQIRYGFYGKVDVAIVEAAKITKDGEVVLTTSIGASPVFCGVADAVIIEINTKKPIELEGIHDIYQPKDPPNRKPIPLVKPEDRIGSPYLKIDLDKIKAIVFTDKEDDPIKFAPVDENSQRIAQHLIRFFEDEVSKGKLPEKLLPLQSGVGSVANAILKGISESSFKDLVFYSEVIQDNVLDLLDKNIFRFASGTSLTLSPEGFKRLYNNIDYYKEKIILRPMEISNNPEIIRRIGSITMNTAIEADLFGNVNSTHIMGRNMMNGIGGSGDFTRAGYLSIFTTPSIAKNGDISSIVPMVSHVDHTEHDVNIIVTEQGLADLRGLSPFERAERITENCANPEYRPQLKAYLKEAKQTPGHTPHLISKALEWHARYMKNKTMKMSE